MQSLAKTSTAGTSYSAAQVSAQFAKNAIERWRFDKVDRTLTKSTDITAYVDMERNPPQIKHDATSIVKRTLSATVRGDIPIVPLSDFIRPWYGLQMPDGGFVEWPLGIFTLLIPDRSISPGYTWLKVSGADLAQLLVDAKFSTTFSVLPGSGYISAVKSAIVAAGLSTPIQISIPDNGAVFTTPLMWQAGDSIMQAINDILEAITYQPAFFDESGVLTSRAFPNYNLVAPYFSFDTTAGNSIIGIPILSKVDVSKAFNQVRVTVDDPARGFFSAYVENVSPGSIVSIPNWHPKLLVVKDSKIASPQAAQARALLELQRGAWAFTEYTTQSVAWPVSQDLDIYGFTYSATDEGLVQSSVLELGWTHNCRAGRMTDHTWLRLVRTDQ